MKSKYAENVKNLKNERKPVKMYVFLTFKYVKTCDNQNKTYMKCTGITFYSLLNYVYIILVVACLQLFKSKKHFNFYQFSSIFYIYDVSAYFDVIYHIIRNDVSDKITNYRMYSYSIII